MKINTDKFGEVEYEVNAVISFTEGILGFPDNKEYILLNAEKDSPFKWLQSTDDMSLAFLLIDPNTFKPDYRIKLDGSTKEELDISAKEDYVVFVIVVVRKDPTQSTANLLGPIILNVENKSAKQLVLNDSNYNTRHLLVGG